VSAQQPHGGEGHRARSEKIEDRREAPAGAGGLDPVASRIFRQPKGLGAIAEQRAIALGGVSGWAAIERGQMGHELDRGLALPAREHVEAREEIVIRESSRGGEDEFRATGGALRGARSAAGRSVQRRGITSDQKRFEEPRKRPDSRREASAGSNRSRAASNRVRK
jgi:hypothetical protein